MTSMIFSLKMGSKNGKYVFTFSECFDNPSESSELANSIPDSNGLFFVPAFCGLQAPVNDPTAAAGLIGNTSLA